LRKLDVLFIVAFASTLAVAPALSAAVIAAKLLFKVLESTIAKKREISYLMSAYAFAFAYLTGLERGMPAALNAVLATRIEPYAADFKKLRLEVLRGKPLHGVIGEYAEKLPALPSKIALLSPLSKREKLNYIRELVILEMKERISAYLAAASLAIIGNYLLLLMLLMLFTLGRLGAHEILLAAVSASVMEVAALEYWSRVEAGR